MIDLSQLFYHNRAMAKEKMGRGRPVKNKLAPGVFLRGKTFWLAYSVGGEQIQMSLGTTDPKTAIEKADELRGRAVKNKKTGKIIGGKTPMDLELEKYLGGKQASGDLRELAANNTRQAVKHFVSLMEISDPAKITSDILAKYYTKTKQTKSESTAQTYTTRVGTFARGIGYRVQTPKFSEVTPSRDVVISRDRISELIDLAADPEIKFVLYCGFLAGMRRGEITMARPQWFDLGRGRINIPSPDTVTGWKPKSGRKRSIPLIPAFATWIRETYPDWSTRAFCLRPEKSLGKWIYRFDFRKLVEAFSKKHCPELTSHVMRHTFATIHANNPAVSIAQLSEWTGDRIATLEKHYLHMETDAAKAADSYKSAADRAKENLAAAVEKRIEKKVVKRAVRVKKDIAKAQAIVDLGYLEGACSEYLVALITGEGLEAFEDESARYPDQVQPAG
ncbi:MAG: tyrosine-type recombinase/integrase [Luteolibacter sp.]